MTLTSPLSQREQLASLRSQLATPAWRSHSRIPLSALALQQLFPSIGLPEGSLVELLSPHEGVGAWSFALTLMRELQRQRFTPVLIDNFREFFPPGAAQLGVDLEQLIIVQPASLSDQLWAIEQILRCPGQTVVLSALGRIPSTTYRRLKLAGERGGGLGVFLRPANLRASPSWADQRLLVESSPSLSRSRRYKVTALNPLEGTVPHTVLECCDESGSLSMVSPLANSTASTKCPRAS